MSDAGRKRWRRTPVDGWLGWLSIGLVAGAVMGATLTVVLRGEGDVTYQTRPVAVAPCSTRDLVSVPSMQGSWSCVSAEQVYRLCQGLGGWDCGIQILRFKAALR